MNVLKPFSQQEPPFPLSQILQEVIDRGASLKAFSDKYAKTIRRERNGTENWKTACTNWLALSFISILADVKIPISWQRFSVDQMLVIYQEKHKC